MKITDIMLFGKAINGDGGDSGVKAMLVGAAADVDFELNVDGTLWYRIGTYIPTVEEMQSAVLILNTPAGGGAGVRAANFSIDDVSDIVGFPNYLVYSETSTTFEFLFAVFGADAPEEGFEAGTYINAAFCMFPAVSGLIIGA